METFWFWVDAEHGFNRCVIINLHWHMKAKAACKKDTDEILRLTFRKINSCILVWCFFKTLSLITYSNGLKSLFSDLFTTSFRLVFVYLRLFNFYVAFIIKQRSFNVTSFLFKFSLILIHMNKLISYFL